MNESLAIVGSGPDCVDAPFDLDYYDIWGVNTLHLKLSPFTYRFTAWFELHDRTFQDAKNTEHMKVLRRDFAIAGIPVFMQRRWQDIPTSKTFPKKAVEKLHPTLGPYHAGTVDWVFAMAILRGYRNIHLYGMNYSRGEPPSARACLECWIGFALGKGIEVYLPQQGDLMKQLVLAKTDRQYGYDSIFNQNELPLI